VLFEVEESDPLFVLGQDEALLARTKNYGWPVSRYDGLQDLAAQLTPGGARTMRAAGPVTTSSSRPSTPKATRS
jgi:hypothetical protein